LSSNRPRRHFGVYKDIFLRSFQVINFVSKLSVIMKTSQKKHLEDEEKILSELQRNSKSSVETIAKRCGLSRQKVFRIIKNLEQNHTIWGYGAIINHQMQRRQKFELLIKRSSQKLQQTTVDAITVSQLEPMYEAMGIFIESSYYLHGEYDWALIFTAQDIRHATKFKSFLLEHFPGIITQTTLMQILFTQREHFIFNPDQTKLQEML
jgi:DNA-binding Lrp family transcriptional regulator